jgi:hypothetical protein
MAHKIDGIQMSYIPTKELTALTEELANLRTLFEITSEVCGNRNCNCPGSMKVKNCIKSIRLAEETLT